MIRSNEFNYDARMLIEMLIREFAVLVDLTPSFRSGQGGGPGGVRWGAVGVGVFRSLVFVCCNGNEEMLRLNQGRHSSINGVARLNRSLGPSYWPPIIEFSSLIIDN